MRTISTRAGAEPTVWRWRGSRGQTATEFALIATALMMLIFGVIDLAQAVYSYNTVCYAASTAIRYASLNGASSPSPATSATVQSLVMGLATGLDATSSCPASGANALCAITTWNPNKSAGSTVKVVVTYNFQPFAPFLPTALLGLSSTQQMVIPN
jgi:Flp pilus assembly protein TadG